MSEYSTDTPVRVLKYGVPSYISIAAICLMAFGMLSSVAGIMELSKTTGDVTIHVLGQDRCLTHAEAIAFRWTMAVASVCLMALAITMLVLRPHLRLYRDRLSIPKHPLTSRQVIIWYATITRVTVDSVSIYTRRVFLEISHPGGRTRIFAGQLPYKKEDLANLIDWLREKCQLGVFQGSLRQFDEDE